jgi:hypothetical protein
MGSSYHGGSVVVKRERLPGAQYSTRGSAEFDKSPAGVRRAKLAVLSRLGLGESVPAAMQMVGRTENTYKEWRKTDKDFAVKANDARAGARKKAADASAPQSAKDSLTAVLTPERAYYGAREYTFVEFREEFLGEETYEHMMEWAALLEEGPMADGLAAARDENRLTCGSPKRLIINEPPFHGKTAVVSMSYALYRICMNLNVRIIMVSKTIDMAKKILYGIKQRLTDPRWSKLQAEFAPPGGFNPPGNKGAWTQDAIYVAGSTSGEKDPTVQAVGIGGTIYGARTDLSILDDISDLTNAHQFEKQIDYIEQDLASRGKDAKIILVGTRTGRRDVYQELADPHRYITGKSPWTRLVQPAVKKYADDPRDWETLWPRTHRPLDANSEDVPDEEGMYSAWDGPALSFVRGSMSPWRWALVYQQEDSVEDTIFKPEAVWGSVDARRKPGPMSAEAWGGAGVSRDSLWTIGSLDPAMSGDSAFMVMSLDRTTRKRWVENVWIRSKGSPEYFRSMIERLTDEYGINEWVIEKAMFGDFIMQMAETREFLKHRGVIIRAHYTGSNKQDPDLGVATLEPLFGSLTRETEGGKFKHNKDNLIQLPDPDKSEGIRKLIEQLVTWEPNVRGSKLTQDAVMALWFAELAARTRVNAGFAGGEGAQNAQVHSRFRPSGRTSRLRIIG